MSKPPLAPEALYTVCDPAQLPFVTTAELAAADGVIGQDRAVAAIRFAIGMRHEGYNLFALGPEGTGKYTVVRRFLGEAAADLPVPPDWCYVNNFTESHRPLAISLPPGQACTLRSDMEQLVEDLRAAIPAIFEGEEYRNRKSVIEESFKERNEQAFGGLQKRAHAQNIALIQSPVGLALAPVREGEVMKPQQFQELPEEERTTFETHIEALQKELAEVIGQIPGWEKEMREKLRELDREVTLHAVGFLIDEMKRKWGHHAPVAAFLESVRTDVVENVEEFLPQEQQAPPAIDAQLPTAARRGLRAPSFFRRYLVNVVVDNTRLPAGTEEGEQICGLVALSGAPVVYEDHPTLPNLIGRVEHLSQFGSLVTDFNLIKSGALHRANGGFLILDSRRLLAQPLVWESLKRTLRAGRIRIESAGEEMGFMPTISLQPEPIPLTVKVVLIGDPEIYYLLSRLDPDFRELFKVAADFDDRMDRVPENTLHYARLLATVATGEGLLPLERAAVARMEERAARMVEDAEKLSTHIGDIKDLLREADYWARQDAAAAIAARHVEQAIEARVHRSDRVRERIQEQIERDIVHIHTAGAVVGQINGLAVLQLDTFAFGRPSRITCRVRVGKGEVIDIERQVELGGPLHTKGVLILSSYLSSQFAHDAPLSLSASLVFEQSYGGVDGDSASSTELYALLSALSGIPIRQSFAVTGSVDQYGRVQAIGGVNEKIEGFFDICRERGLTGEQGVLIPASNVKHLMLRADVVAAAREGLFRIFPVATIEEGIELLTGVPAGERGSDGAYPIGSVFRAVAIQLATFAARVRQYGAGNGERPRRRRKRGGDET